ncbi:MAG: fatty acid CoA ligase family protein [Planctomycetota bacterium]
MKVVPDSRSGGGRVNVADRLAVAAAERPDVPAVIAYTKRRRPGEPHPRYHDPRVLRTASSSERLVAFEPEWGQPFAGIAFGDLNEQADVLARGLTAMGVGPGKRIALLVKPGVEFVTLVFALLRTGATMVLVDAGLGRKNIVRCLASTEPDGFVAIPLGHAMRVLKRKHFPRAKLNVTVGRRWFWGGETLASVRELGEASSATLPATQADEPAAICFTSGSTGPPKGVLYTHQTFVTQCDEIQRHYDLRPGAVDLACFPLFGLFNVACGITTVLPDMDFSRPASCDPKKVLAAANQWQVTQAFASPAVWDRLSRHCEETGESIPTLKKVFSCGAPVPAKVLRRTLACVHPGAEMHTPYGATESLPVATIEAREILDETAAKTDEGAGVCVGRKFDTIDWRVIRISDEPLHTIDDTQELPAGEIGELIVRGPQVSKQYLSEPSAQAGEDDPHSGHNAASKITDGDTIWHRIGDVGYFDEQERFWYCGRKSQRVVTEDGTLYTECVEAMFRQVTGVESAALVATGDDTKPHRVLVWTGMPADHLVARRGYPDKPEHRRPLSVELADVHADRLSDITDTMSFLYRETLPTDIRHNSKIRREELALWAAKQLAKPRRP